MVRSVFLDRVLIPRAYIDRPLSKIDKGLSSDLGPYRKSSNRKQDERVIGSSGEMATTLGRTLRAYAYWRRSMPCRPPRSFQKRRYATSRNPLNGAAILAVPRLNPLCSDLMSRNRTYLAPDHPKPPRRA